MPISVHVQAPSRLHFGLMNFGGEAARQFGGIGVMIDTPGIELTAAPAEAFRAAGAYADRVHEFARRWQTFHQTEAFRESRLSLRDNPEALPACAIDVVRAPREHTGLGVGTQLGLSVAAALSRLTDLPEQTPTELAASVGRGQRSAVGAYGFVLGGLIAERGKLPGEPVSPLDCHLSLPEGWRVVLVCPRETAGLASDAEASAFATLPPVPERVTSELASIARDRLLPAAAQGDFAPFATAVYDYGHLSGACFASLQGGPYNGQRLTNIVQRLRSLGAIGVGQSSWGPTIFAFAPDEGTARDTAEAFGRFDEARNCDVQMASISRRGASVTPYSPKCEQVDAARELQ